MSDFKLLVDDQQTVIETIKKFALNFSKDSRERKTENYYTTKISDVKAIWNKFVNNDDQLKSFFEDNKDDEYWIQREEINNTYEKLLSKLKEGLAQFKTNPGSTSTGLPPNNEKDSRKKFRNRKIEIFNHNIHNLQDELAGEVTKQFCKQKLQNIQEQWSIIQKLFDIFVEEANDNEFEIELESFCDLQKRFECVCIKLKEFINEENETPITQNQSKAGIKLPKIEIPKYNGSYLKWREFHDLFKEIIDKNDTLKNIEKMQYLKTYVQGDALAPISHLELSNENYNSAWNILKERFENKRIIVDKCIEALMTQPCIGKDSRHDLRRLHDTTKECLHALNRMQIDTTTWDPILLHIIENKLDKDSRTIYEQSVTNPKETQEIRTMLNFLEKRYQLLESTKELNMGLTKNLKHTKSPQSFIAIQQNCSLCHGEHKIMKCDVFNKMNVKDRRMHVRNKNLCFNCLNTGHSQSKCRCPYKCKICKGWHNTMLHENKVSTSPSEEQHKIKTLMTNQKENVLLATAIVNIKTGEGKELQIRALLDQGSQGSFITKNIVKQLMLPIRKTLKGVSGLGATSGGKIHGKVTCTIASKENNNYELQIDAYILDKITNALPNSSFQKERTSELKNIILADPHYNISSNIDLLIGADFYGYLLMDGIIKTKEGLIAQQTELGWAIFGPYRNLDYFSNKMKCMVTNIEIDKRLQEFWEQEDQPIERKFTADEEHCEDLYSKSVKRRKDGRYIVRLPFKNDQVCLGESRGMAIARYNQLEKRFDKNESFRIAYKECIHEYIKLGHMRRITIEDRNNSNNFYLPHHAVIKENSATTRLRVVFDGSAKTSNGFSLNDTQLVGPTIQQTLFDILLRWRKHRIAFIADIEKMYRQIFVDKDHQQYQRIIWRDDKSQPLRDYCLTTVTFGTSSAPYLAIKTLNKLAIDDGDQNPIGAEISTRDFYVDDVLSGEDNVEKALNAKTQLKALLKGGGFNLRKWYSNHKMLQDHTYDEHEISRDNKISTLGIHWNNTEDTLGIKLYVNKQIKGRITKRVFLSEASKVYDPLGWLSPSTVKTKILFQDLWIAGLTWDQELPEKMANSWLKIKEETSMLNSIALPRWIHYETCSKRIEIHGFCDASEKAYSAVVYTKVTSMLNEVQVTLMCAKTKVAPINKRVSIPRLELNAALLLCKLIKRVNEALKITNIEIFAWSDSEIVLAWLRGHPSKWKTFVANRVSEINSVLQPGQWHHIKSMENPADCASRGIYPSELLAHNLWWNGPKWLNSYEHQSVSDEFVTDMEMKAINKPKMSRTMKTTDTEDSIQVNIATHEHFIESFLERYSSWNLTLKVLSFSFRFINNTRSKKSDRKTGWLSREELNKARLYIIRIVQSSVFHDDITSLKRSGIVHTKSQLKSLTPFLDSENILRVGGRLSNANVSYSTKHPIILPKKHSITLMIIRDNHLKYLHPGASLMTASLRQQYWILGCKEIVRQFVHNCNVCFRHKQHTGKQLMGQLPAQRVTISKPFQHTGIDYAGPIIMKMMRTRNAKHYKGYIVIFICSATKAIHLEVASDLTSDSCLAAINRFISRRGLPSDIYSDNGTNFIGVRRQLNEMEQLVKNQTFNNHIAQSLISKQINWHMIPPSAPNFGGLWEAGVKSTKYHLKRVIGDAVLTLEELYTLLTQIEAILNSRPLSVLASDQLDPLTPAHFLIGAPLTQITEPSLEHVKIGRLSRWQLVQQMTQGFWKRWSNEYLTTLQQTPKHWRKAKPNIGINDIVIIKDENNPPTKWLMGRVVELHPGKDDIIRVVTLKTKNGICKRPIVKLTTMPIEDLPISTPEPEHHQVVDENITTLTCTTIQTKRISSNKPVATASFFFILWLLSIILKPQLCTANDEGIMITPFKQQSGIYFEGVGHINMIDSYWKLIVIVNSTSYNQNVENSLACMKNISTFNINPNIYSLLNYHLSEILTNDELLQMGKHDSRKNRLKRGLVDIIGNAANALFGVLDQNDAHHYNEQFELLKNNEDHLIHLVRNQTSITELTVQALKHDEESIHQQFTKMMDTINDQRIKEAIRYNDTTKIGILTTITQYCSLLLSNTQTLQNRIMDILLFSHQGNVHPSLLPISQMKIQLMMIRQHIAKHLSILGDHSKDGIVHIYKLMTAKAGKANGNIVIEIRIPLIRDETFQMFKIIPIPTLHNGDLTYIKSSSDYIAVNLQREHYIPMTEEDLKSCILIFDDYSVCNIKSPTFTRASNRSVCEIDLLHHKEFSPYCKIRKTINHKHWIPMYAADSWVYSFKYEHTIDIICNNTIRSSKLNGNGIIRLKPFCIIRDEEIIISAKQDGQTTLSISFIPLQNISAAITKGSYIIPEESEVGNWIGTFKNEELIRIQDLIKRQQQEERLPNSLTSHDIHHYTMLYIILILIFLSLIICCIRRRRNIINDRINPPIPQPRQLHPINDDI